MRRRGLHRAAWLGVAGCLFLHLCCSYFGLRCRSHSLASGNCEGCFSVSGQRSESLTFLIDGVDNNDFLGNNAVVDPNPDAVEEFKILTNNYGAEYGRTSGGIVNQVIKSGTNAFHGGVFEFFRNDDLNARNYFQLERTRFNRNLFGGTIGGPIHKDKTFFFISYQGSRRIEGQVAPVLTVLSPAGRYCYRPLL